MSVLHVYSTTGSQHERPGQQQVEEAAIQPIDRAPRSPFCSRRRMRVSRGIEPKIMYFGQNFLRGALPRTPPGLPPWTHPGRTYPSGATWRAHPEE